VQSLLDGKNALRPKNPGWLLKALLSAAKLKYYRMVVGKSSCLWTGAALTGRTLTWKHQCKAARVQIERGRTPWRSSKCWLCVWHALTLELSVFIYTCLHFLLWMLFATSQDSHRKANTNKSFFQSLRFLWILSASLILQSKMTIRLGTVAYTCNLSYMGGSITCGLRYCRCSSGLGCIMSN
jgi:hypothetical protein